MQIFIDKGFLNKIDNEYFIKSIIDNKLYKCYESEYLLSIIYNLKEENKQIYFEDIYQYEFYGYHFNVDYKKEYGYARLKCPICQIAPIKINKKHKFQKGILNKNEWLITNIKNNKIYLLSICGFEENIFKNEEIVDFYCHNEEKYLLDNKIETYGFVKIVCPYCKNHY